MKRHFSVLAGFAMLAALIASGDRMAAQEPAAPAQHDHAAMMGPMPDHHDMAAMMTANNARLDELMAKVQQADTSGAKTDALVAVVAALIEHQKMCAEMMGSADHK